MDLNLILSSIGVFLVIILLLVVILLVAKKYLSPSGKVTVTINGKDKVEVEQGSSLLTTLSENGIYLPSACGGKGSCGQCKCQVVEGMDYDKDIDKSLIGEEYLPAWKKFGLFPLKCVNTEPTVRAYSMANYPAEGDVFMLTVRIATPPFKADRSGFMDVNPGIASSYIFTLKPGDKVIMSGPYGDFHPHFDSKKEMIWVGGGAGMAPLRAQIMHMTRTLHCTDREMHYFYGARALNEVFYLQDFLQLEKDFPNFHFHLALDRPDPAADAAGVKYTAGFVHQVMYNTYLKDHDAPEDIEYYMCGPGPMSKAVVGMLDSLGVEAESIMYDNFGG